MSAFGSRQSSNSFMRICESECSTSTAASLKDQGEGSVKRWSMKLGLKQRGDLKEVKSNKSQSLIKKFRHSFNAKFTILSLVLLVFFMSGSAVAVPVDDASSTTSVSASTTSSSSDTQTAVTVDSTGGSVDNPILFDTVTINSNTTTTTCPAFFATFLQDADFLNCLPLSALLLNSQSFFEITKDGAFSTTQIIDRTCNVDINNCQSIMDKLGREITMDENCGADYRLGNPIVGQAYAAFIAYKPVYTAGCLKSDSGSYCYVDAITNTSSPSDSYAYYLPVGRSLPGGARPTCSTCLQNTMRIFSAFAGNSTQPLYDTYVPAAQLINLGCGPDFVNSSVEALFTGAVGKASLPATLLLSTVLLVISVIIM